MHLIFYWPLVLQDHDYICLVFLLEIFFYYFLFGCLFVCLFLHIINFCLHILYDNGKDWKQNVTHCIVIVNSFAWKIILNECDALCSIAMVKKKSQYVEDMSTISNENWYQCHKFFLEENTGIFGENYRPTNVPQTNDKPYQLILKCPHKLVKFRF